MMNGFAVIIHFVGASLFIIPAQYVKAFQVSSLSAESANFSSTPPYSKNRTVLEIESNNENNVSTPTNSPLGNANVNASYTGSEQTAFSTTEGLKNNATPSFTQTEIPERFNTTATLPKTSNVTPSKEFKTTTTAENKQVKPERKTVKFGIIVVIIIAVVILVTIIVFVAIYLLNRKGKTASYNPESSAERIPINEAGTGRSDT
ncbi:putative GPI-anchored protein pfl2 isoform X2 [Carcharodon carcharias]|uniref:putative GPI-anchored protein pfl2 isoform X2 n=1 Tax=Carcharodon carcharias TaxID=13397 RepID=UPI001B7E621B|nr:putative GPI-anchored protein pfl2 isoform X2 [Carcharodon carcharias]